jgi:threonine/homoserine/homoserine lactone efflux protein
VVHTLATVVGISAILMTSALAFSVLKYLGAAYLLWMGARMLLSRPAVRGPTPMHGSGVTAAFYQGTLTNVLNPKVALFYLAFLPQFVSPDAAHPQLGLMLLGLSYVAMGGVWFSTLALMGGRVHRLLIAKPGLGQSMDRLCGAILIGFGIQLALQQRI